MGKIIHFICRGNTYRSRMAEAYFNSLNIPGWQAISSGVGAARNLNGSITGCAKFILEQRGLLAGTGPGWTETTRELVAKSDLVIFMQEEYFVFCRDRFGLVPSRFEVWNIEDIDDGILASSPEERILAIAENTFARIASRIDRLAGSLGGGIGLSFLF